jgi:HSP20 family protein
MNKSNSNVVSLFEVIDNMFESYNSYNYHDTAGNLWDTELKNFPYKISSWWADFKPPLIVKPNYPVSNCYVLGDGTSILELAVTGFTKENLTIIREDDNLIIEGKRNKKHDENTKIVWDNIAYRDFKITYKCSAKVDLTKIKSTLENGVLKIIIPLKEESKPVKQVIDIS